MTSNYVDENGLTTQTLTEIITELETGFKTIYGTDINVDANSPDGQMINLFAQAKIDILDCIAQVYGSFSPTSAIGRALDQRCAINGVIRKGATKTTVQMTVVTDRVLTLVGVASNTGTPFAVKDAAGNRFLLSADSTLTIGSNLLMFEAETLGAIQAPIGTITQVDTLIAGITSVTNASSPTTQGVDEETDAALRYRRAVSVSLSSQGYLEGLKGALLSLTNVTKCEVYENNTNATDGDGIHAHSIWVVIEGGDTDEIADIIYKKRNAGCGLFGSFAVDIDQGNGFNLPIKFDRPSYEDLYIELTITSLNSAHTIDDDYLKDQIYELISYGINEKADYSAIASLVKIADPLAVIIDGGVSSDGITYVPYLATPSIDGIWTISTTRIAITVV
jgi:uncharacterized phage protein gp47/JayE